jgi:hypothetical protein
MTQQPFLYPLPSFLKGTVTHPDYDDWLDNKARELPAILKEGERSGRERFP